MKAIRLYLIRFEYYHIGRYRSSTAVAVNLFFNGHQYKNWFDNIVTFSTIGVSYKMFNHR